MRPRLLRLLAFSAALAAAFPSHAGAAQPEPVRLFAAGSLTRALGEVVRHFIASDGGHPVETTFGPSGLLRERIERGEVEADVFFSASLEHAVGLEHAGRTVAPAVIFVRNRLCLLTRPGFRPVGATVLDTLLDRHVRLGTSTPGADPSGDYAWELFRRADALRAGARATLEAKALQLVGGPSSAAPPPGVGAVGWHLREGRADVFLGYCTSAALAASEVPGVGVHELPEPLAVGADYGLALLSARPEAVRLALYALSPAGQAILAKYGFTPVAEARTGS